VAPHGKLLTPRDLADEAEEQLDELKNIVRGDILVAHADLQSLQTAFMTYSDNILKNGAIEIQQEFEAVDGQLTTTMAKSVVFLCALLAVSHGKLLTPRDLADEAEEQLDELKSFVQGDILVAHADLQSLQTAVLTYSDNILKNGAIEIQQEAEAVDGQLTTIKRL
jgi:DNA polymerase III alpha subunit (gram-positive type)